MLPIKDVLVLINNVEVFIINQNTHQFIAYCPLKNLVLSVNNAWVNALYDHCDDEMNIAINDNRDEFLDDIYKIFIDDISNTKDVKECELSIGWPTSVTFILSSLCNLKCTYCFVYGGEGREVLSWSAISKAIDLVLSESHKTSVEPLINFSGDGEPTVTWGLLQRAVEYAKLKATVYGLRPKFIMNTNGYFNSQKAKWITENFYSVCLSFDGPRDIQNSQRPNLGGRGSFDKVYATAKYFYENKFRFSLRPTITEASSSRIVEIVDFFDSNFPGTKISLEPMSEQGRACSNKLIMPDDISFLQGYLESTELLKKRKSPTIIVYQGVSDPSEIRKDYCGICEPNFVLTPRGEVTSCFGYSWKDNFALKFKYGYFDENLDQFIFEEDKIKKLQRLTLPMASSCEKCFAKYQCGGDCPAIRIKKDPFNDDDFVSSYAANFGRCVLNRSLLLKDLNDILSNQKECGPS